MKSLNPAASHRRTVLAATVAGLLLCCRSTVAHPPSDQVDVAVVDRFLGPDGFGRRHPQAPAQTEQFGRLVGVWHAEQDVRKQDGSWAPQPPALWAWQYVLDGFAVQDLWFQAKDALPAYLGISGRPYMLTALRIFDVKSKRWHIGWAANGGGKSPSPDWGTLTAEVVGHDLVLTGPPVESPGGQRGRQRVVFSRISRSRFEWRSEFSRDEGKTWTAVVRVRARRLR